MASGFAQRGCSVFVLDLERDKAESFFKETGETLAFYGAVQNELLFGGNSFDSFYGVPKTL